MYKLRYREEEFNRGIYRGCYRGCYTVGVHSLYFFPQHSSSLNTLITVTES